MRQPNREELISSESIDRAIATIGNGEIIIVVDDDDRENEGDLIMAASMATPEKMAFYHSTLERHSVRSTFCETSATFTPPSDGRRKRRAFGNSIYRQR